MADGGGGASGPPSSINNSSNNRYSSSSSAPLDGAFLLQLLRNPPQSQSQSRQPQTPSPLSFVPDEILNPHRDPVVAAVGATYPFAPHAFLRPTHHPPPPQETPPRFSLPLRSSFPAGFSRGGDQWAPPGFPSQFSSSPPVYSGDFPRNSPIHQQDGGIRSSGKNLDSRAWDRGNAHSNLSAEPTHWLKPNSSMMHPQVPFDRNHCQGASSVNHWNAVSQRPGMMEPGVPPPAAARNRRVPSKERRDGKHISNNYNSNVKRVEYNPREGSTQYTVKREFLSRHGGGSSDVHITSQSSCQFDQSGGGGRGRNHEFFDESDREKFFEERDDFGSGKNSSSRYLDDLPDQLEESLVLGEDTVENNVAKHSNSSRGKDVRIDLFRGQYVSCQRVRIRRRELECRYDIDSLTPLFLAIYKSLIPADEEKGKQKQLLLTLRNLVNKEWPDAQLHLYGSCANSFGVSKSDIDICLAIGDSNLSKAEILLKLSDILQSDNLQNVQALTHARVPIVKMMDPVTGISCDICINNLLAVANTKLLRDYAQIDDRLRQLAFIVKHWAKSRGVNETYRGTLSSYAYVLMCIHFLQQRKPAILPCLQEMEATYVVNVDGIHCAFFDQVDRLHNFGSQNNESIARLLWGFFHYWAYYHDYTNDVISVRTGQNISKRAKDWTRRIGNDRHLICIEDPFETSHDLGRVVDKYSIKILREEFERAADILQYDSNPSVTLFEPYVPGSMPNGLPLD